MKLKIVVLMWIDIQTHPGWQPEESEFTIIPPQPALGCGCSLNRLAATFASIKCPFFLVITDYAAIAKFTGKIVIVIVVIVIVFTMTSPAAMSAEWRLR